MLYLFFGFLIAANIAVWLTRLELIVEDDYDEPA